MERYSPEMWDQLKILNPKRHSASPTPRDGWFPYYAGFSSDFASELLRSSNLPSGSTCMDPWNGSGTTTTAASLFQHRVLGYDLNPVMVAVARGRLLPLVELPSISPLLEELTKKSIEERSDCDSADPLLTWFAPIAATSIRSIERSIHKLLVSADSTVRAYKGVSQFSAIASFFYVGLFRAVRDLLQRFTPSNPTWIRKPTSSQARIRPSAEAITNLFRQYITEMVTSVSGETCDWDANDANYTISVASSHKLPIPDKSVDFVLTSPPYCTRIDYAISTSPELAVLGLSFDRDLRELRSQLIGTPTIHATAPDAQLAWGPTCSNFLDQVRTHSSKAAKSYYYKTFVQYFEGIDASLQEISRCLKTDATCVIVVQDSYFKEIKADLPVMFTELAEKHGLEIGRRNDFPMTRTLASINTKSKRYRESHLTAESVLSFRKG
jgi:SAM-dependent methyltransferase